MSKRLQVLLSDRAMADVQRLAEGDGLSVGEWVRRVLREACAGRPRVGAEMKLRAVREAAEYSFPVEGTE